MTTARVPTIPLDGLTGAFVRRMSRKMLGQVPDQLGVMWHHQPMLRTFMSLGGKSKKWAECPAELKAYAHMAVAAQVGCGFCLDFGYFQAHHDGLDLATAREVPRWRESTAFTPLERDVLAYAEAMTTTPPTVTDELSARLLDALGPAGLIELTGYVGIANLMTRSNVALGVESAEFAAACGLEPIRLPAPADA